jgi:hypothetical protein
VGTGSPGHHGAVHRRLAEFHLSVGGDPLSGAHHEPLAGRQVRDRDPTLGLVVGQHTHIPGARRGQLPHRVPGVPPGLRLIQPAGQQERGHRGGDLQVDPAAGGVQQQVPGGQPGLAAVQHEHRKQRPAARRGDAQRHQRVHRNRAVPGAAQRGLMERPRRPDHYRHRQHCQDPLPAREPERREQRQQHRQITERDEEHQRHDQPVAQVHDALRIGPATSGPGWAAATCPSGGVAERLSAVTRLLDRLDEPQHGN